VRALARAPERGVIAARLARFGLGALLAIGLFLTCFERTTRTEDTGPGEAAQRNRYLAAERLLEALGLPVVGLDHPEQMRELPPLDATLIVPGRRFELPGLRSAQLLEWVERGGHLVVVAWTLWTEEPHVDDPILDPLGVRQFMTAEDEAEDSPYESAEWVHEPGAAPLRMSFLPEYTLEIVERRADWSVSDANGVHGLSVPVGHGHVTVWTDDLFFTNESLAQQDHAEALHRLVLLHGKRGAWIVRGDAQVLDAWSQLLARGWCIGLGVVLWLAFHLWSRAPLRRRIGLHRTEARRELLEHVQASGAFLLRHGGSSALLAAVHHALAQRLRARHGHWTTLPPHTRIERVSEQTGIPVASVERALAPDDSPPLMQFTQRVQLLEEIRRKL
jgi:hypothetical protein